jgi:hypothetical protein
MILANTYCICNTVLLSGFLPIVSVEPVCLTGRKSFDEELLLDEESNSTHHLPVISSTTPTAEHHPVPTFTITPLGTFHTAIEHPPNIL